MKGDAGATREARYEDIEAPRGSALGFVTAFFAVVFGFAMVWHIWWMAGVGSAGIVVALLAFAWRSEAETTIPASELARFDRGRAAASERA
jgi:cytochrome o ubiquinol oxidase subunit 1